MMRRSNLKNWAKQKSSFQITENDWSRVMPFSPAYIYVSLSRGEGAIVLSIGRIGNSFDHLLFSFLYYLLILDCNLKINFKKKKKRFSFLCSILSKRKEWGVKHRSFHHSCHLTLFIIVHYFTIAAPVWQNAITTIEQKMPSKMIKLHVDNIRSLSSETKNFLSSSAWGCLSLRWSSSPCTESLPGQDGLTSLSFDVHW